MLEGKMFPWKSHSVSTRSTCPGEGWKHPSSPSDGVCQSPDSPKVPLLVLGVGKSRATRRVRGVGPQYSWKIKTKCASRACRRPRTVTPRSPFNPHFLPLPLTCLGRGTPSSQSNNPVLKCLCKQVLICLRSPLPLPWNLTSADTWLFLTNAVQCFSLLEQIQKHSDLKYFFYFSPDRLQC